MNHTEQNHDLNSEYPERYEVFIVGPFIGAALSAVVWKVISKEWFFVTLGGSA